MNKKSRKVYCVYIHYNKITEEPFYVGKGSIKRANSKHSRSDNWNAIANKFGYEVEIVNKNLTELQAFEKESSLIEEIGRKDLGRGPLVNKADGDKSVTNLSVVRTDKELLEVLSVTKCDRVGDSKIINIGTKEVFDNIEEAAKSVNMKSSTLEVLLNDKDVVNSTYFEYLN